MTDIEKSLIQIIIDLIEKHTCIHYDSAKQHFPVEIYADYRDDVSAKTVGKWCQADNPRDAFWEDLSEWFQVAVWEAEDELIKAVRDNWDCKIHSFEQNEEFITEWIKESMDIRLPEKHYLSKRVCVDIIVDTGDANYDFVLNDFYPHYNARIEDVIHKEASLLWLARQQGYSKRQLNAAVRKSEFSGSKLLKSIRQEVLECHSHMNALTFFVEMTVGELLDLQEAIKENAKKDIGTDKHKPVWNRKGRGSITLSKDSPCGLYDTWSGASSILEIELEKDVVLPMKYIDTAWPDGERGYSLARICGFSSDFWKKGLLKVA